MHYSSSTSTPKSYVYRQQLEDSLPEAFERLHLAFAGDDTEDAKKAALATLKSWQICGIFNKQYMLGLEASFLRGVVPVDSIHLPTALKVQATTKFAEWRLQHFSQLEKLCKSKGLRWSTAGLTSFGGPLSSDEATRRREWLIDRLAMYELHAFEEAAVAQLDQPRNPLPAPNPDLDGDSLTPAEFNEATIALDRADSFLVYQSRGVGQRSFTLGKGGRMPKRARSRIACVCVGSCVFGASNEGIDLWRNKQLRLVNRV